MSSLQDRLAARREQLQHDRSFVLAVPGYEDLLAVRYRVLGYRELRKIGRRNAKLEGTDEGELAVAADTLINACIELLEVKDDGAYASTGHRWTPAAARELFAVDLTDGTPAREVIFAVFPPTETELMVHFNAYDGQLPAAVAEIEDEVLGESEASSTPEEQSISQ